MGDSGLTPWLDATLQPEDLSPHAVASEEALRLSKLVTMAAMTTNIPRRIGDATREEYAADNRIGRQIAHRMSKVLTYWVVKYKPGPVSEAKAPTNAEAAQVVWKEWWEDHQSLLLRKKRWVASWGVNHSHESEANQFLHLYELEERQLKEVIE